MSKIKKLPDITHKRTSHSRRLGRVRRRLALHLKKLIERPALLLIPMLSVALLLTSLLLLRRLQNDAAAERRNDVSVCDNTYPDWTVDPCDYPQHVVIDLSGVSFQPDRPREHDADIAATLAEPISDSLTVLDQAVDALKRYPRLRVTVANYTDSAGDPAYNQALSERRAKIVYDYLIAHGIEAGRLGGPIGHGQDDPVDDNDSPAGRARNRRTELQVEPTRMSVPALLAR